MGQRSPLMETAIIIQQQKNIEGVPDLNAYLKNHIYDTVLYMRNLL